MTDRTAIIKRLRALLAMTSENGATEAEALVAARKAAELMAEHNLSYSSVDEIEADGFATDERPWYRGSKGRSRAAPKPPVHLVLMNISELCSVEHYYQPYTGNLTFFGAPHDTEIAHYLVVVINRAMNGEWKTYSKRMHARHKRSARTSFFLGMAIRIGDRLNEMRATQQQSTSSNALVVVKGELVKQRFEQQFTDLTNARKPPKPKDFGATVAGWRAGENVPLNKGLKEAQDAPLLTSMREG